MQRKDYLMRIIDDIARMLAKVIFLKSSGEYGEAQEEIKRATGELLGLDPEAINSATDSLLISMLRLTGELDCLRCVTLAELLREQGEIYRLQDAEEEADDSYLKSLSLYLEAAAADYELRPQDHDGINFLAIELDEIELPVHIGQKLFAYFESTGEFGRAEDVLFDLIDSDESPAAIADGISFYQRLLTESDAELIEGNLPRAEVKEGLSELKSRLSLPG